MTTTIYTEARLDAFSQIAQWGAPASLTVLSHSVYNATNDSWGSSTRRVYATLSALTIQMDQEDFQNISLGERAVVLPALFLPDLTKLQNSSYQISVNGRRWEPVEVSPVEPGSIPIVYKVLVKS